MNMKLAQKHMYDRENYWCLYNSTENGYVTSSKTHQAQHVTYNKKCS